jgi:putative ABC transport system ATP-binding protein
VLNLNEIDAAPVVAPSPAAPAVEAREVSRRYGDGESAVDALRGVSLEVPAGQFTAVMGPSGSGKSTLMHILAGLDRPDAGSVSVGGREITDMGDKELTLMRRREIGFVFQFFNLLPVLTAEQNVVLPLQIAGRKPEAGWVDSVIAKLGLADRRDHVPSKLSGGQQQRVAIARALVTEPTVLFADEPTGNLDSATGQEILDLMREAVDAYGQTTMMVTHDPRAAATADRVLFLADGELVSDLDRPDEAAILDVMKAVA